MILKEKKILITGASSGIGYHLARQLSSGGNTLFLLARRKDILDELALSLKNTSSKIFTYKCDVSVKDEVSSAFREIKKEAGEIDIAVLNSGLSYRVPVKKYNSVIGEEIFKVNVFGLIYFIEELLPGFLNKKEGTIIGISSLADARGFPQSGFYSGSKAAATAMLESLRIELKKYNIKVVTVKPGFVRTPMTDKNEFKMPLLMNPEKAAKIIVKGIEKEKSIIQFPLPTVIGAKIFKIMPRFLFDKLMRNR